MPDRMPAGKGKPMRRFMFKVSYSKEGMQGVVKEGAASRATTIEKMAADMGGSIASFDFAFGKHAPYRPPGG